MRRLPFCLALALGCGATMPPPPPPCPEALPPSEPGQPDLEPEWREGFEVSSVANTGLDHVEVQRFLAKAKEQSSTSLAIVVDGALVIEEYYGTDPERPVVAMSATKSVVALAVGTLVDDGHLDLDRPLSEGVLPEWKGGDRSGITALHLLTHRTGLATSRYGQETGDFAGGSIEAHGLASALTHEVGGEWRYNNNMIDFLSVVVHRASPDHLYLDDYLQLHIFAKLGMVGPFWLKDGHGHPRAAGELFMRPIDFAKVGQLVLDDGVWQGQRIVSASFIEQMLAATPGAEFYGLLWWRSGDDQRALAYRADGYLGQYVVIVPEARLVAVRTRDPRVVGDDSKEFGWYDFVWDVLALAGHEVPKADRKRWVPPKPS